MWFYSEHGSFSQVRLTGYGVKVRSGRCTLGCGFEGVLPRGQGETAKRANGGQCQYANCVSLAANLHSHMFLRSLCIV